MTVKAYVYLCGSCSRVNLSSVLSRYFESRLSFLRIIIITGRGFREYISTIWITICCEKITKVEMSVESCSEHGKNLKKKKKKEAKDMGVLLTSCSFVRNFTILLTQKLPTKSQKIIGGTEKCDILQSTMLFSHRTFFSEKISVVETHFQREYCLQKSDMYSNIFLFHDCSATERTTYAATVQ